MSNGVASISVAATKNYSGATLEFINRVDAIQTGATSEVEYILDVGDNLIEVEVTSASGNELKTYTVTVTRAASDDATLSSLELQDANGAAIELIPDFDPATTEYSVSVPNGVESVTLTTEKNHGGASAAILTPSGTSEPDEATVNLSLGSKRAQCRGDRRGQQRRGDLHSLGRTRRTGVVCHTDRGNGMRLRYRSPPVTRSGA